MQAIIASMQAQTVINAPIERVRGWFLTLSDHPERYRFESHEGFVFTRGAFGEIGSEFYTREKFFGIMIKLRFRISDVKKDVFTLSCLPPLKGSWCRFALAAESPEHTCLTLDVNTERRLHAILLNLPGLRNAIQRQINAEVQHIKASIENTNSEGDL